MEVINGPSCYRVTKKVADNGHYRVYLCLQRETDRQCLLQIVNSVHENGELGRAAYVLRELKNRSDHLEAQYAEVNKEPEKYLNYYLGFPELIESFVCAEQGGRSVNILAFHNVKDVGQMVPLSNLTLKDRVRVDLRTSAWIMGRLLKLLAFAHSEGIAVSLLTGQNIVLEPSRHYAVVFDWSQARTTTPGELPEVDQRPDIVGAAQAVLTVLGGDLATGFVPEVDDLANPYVDYLITLAKGGESDSEVAYYQFYKLVDAIWPRKFHPFTTVPL